MSASAKQAVAATRGSQKRVPDFFIVGHAKSGTTALYEILRRHPQIYTSNFKEPQYFARNPQMPADGERSFDQTGRVPLTLDEYLSLFAAARPDQLIGDASTFHLWSPDAPRRIAEAQPDARIIAILREPASFLHSLHLQMVQNHAESEKDLRRALALEDDRRQGRRIPPTSYWPSALIYSDRVHYVEQLRRYHAAFPREQVLVLIYDDFRRDNEATVRTVLRFLELDDAVPIEAIDANPSVRVRSVRLDAVTRAVRGRSGPLGRAVHSTVKLLTTKRARSVLYPLRRRLVYGRPQPADEQLMSELRRRFKGEVVALSEYLDRDLVTLWGYDGLD
jgi:Sulfotransferase family